MCDYVIIHMNVESRIQLTGAAFAALLAHEAAAEYCQAIIKSVLLFTGVCLEAAG